MAKQFRISRDSPAYYLTSVAKNRLPIFRSKALAQIACNALDKARTSGRFLIFAYVLMLDHLHLVTDNSRTTKDTHRFINGILSRRILDYLREAEHFRSLEKLRIAERSDGWKYSLWDHHPNTRLLWNEQMLWQRIQYTHLNPVRAELAEHPDKWLWSSARIFHGKPIEDEPLHVDLERIEWKRKAEA